MGGTLAQGEARGQGRGCALPGTFKDRAATFKDRAATVGSLPSADGVGTSRGLGCLSDVSLPDLLFTSSA